MKGILLLLCCVGSISCWKLCDIFSMCDSSTGEVSTQPSNPGVFRGDSSTEEVSTQPSDPGVFQGIIPMLDSLDDGRGGVVIRMNGSTIANVQVLVSHIENKKGMDQVTIYADGVDDQRMKLLANAISTVKINNMGLHNFADRELQTMAKIFPEIPLDYLRIVRGNISLLGAKALAENLIRSPIVALFFEKCKITNEGFEAIVSILPYTKIETLYLWSNEISGLGMKALVPVLGRTHLKDLQISGITDELFNELNKVKGNITIYRGSEGKEVVDDSSV